MNRIQQAFSYVKASEQLKQDTLTYVQEERIIRKYKSRGRIYRYAAGLAVLILLAGFGGRLFLNQAVSYIDIDGLPSLGLGLNRLNHVVEVQAFNENGVLVAQRHKLKGQPYAAAIDSLLSDSAYDTSLPDNSEVNFSLVSSNASSLLKGIQDCEGFDENSSSCVAYDQDQLDEAHNCGLSLAKYHAYLTLCGYGDGITPEECGSLSIDELNNRISHHVSGNHEGEDHSGDDHQIAGHEAENHHKSALAVTPAPTSAPSPAPAAAAVTKAPASTNSAASRPASTTVSSGNSSATSSSHSSGYCDDSYSYNSGNCNDYSYEGSHHDSSHESGHH